MEYIAITPTLPGKPATVQHRSSLEPPSLISPHTISRTVFPETYRLQTPRSPSFGLPPLYALNNSSRVTNDACKPLPSDTSDLPNVLALIRESPRSAADSCSDRDQVSNLADRGAKYVMW